MVMLLLLLLLLRVGGLVGFGVRARTSGARRRGSWISGHISLTVPTIFPFIINNKILKTQHHHAPHPRWDQSSRQAPRGRWGAPLCWRRPLRGRGRGPGPVTGIGISGSPRGRKTPCGRRGASAAARPGATRSRIASCTWPRWPGRCASLHEWQFWPLGDQ